MADTTPAPYSRPLTNIERIFTRSPYSIVTLVLRLRGRVNERSLVDAVDKVSQRHSHLRARIAEDERGGATLTEEGAGAPQVQAVPRASDDSWIRAVEEACQVPFDFGARPPVRFLLLESLRATDIVILCHHIICDGMSLAYVARDLLAHLANPALAVERLPDALPMDRDNLPAGVKANGIARMAIGRMNRKWARERAVFDQEDYRSLHRGYWGRYRHRVLPAAWDEDETTGLVERCRAQQVTVTSALTAAFVGAQVAVLGEKEFHERVAVAADLRERLRVPPGEAMGFYAGLARPRFRYDAAKGFWDNVRAFHAAAGKLYTDKALFQDPLLWTYLDATILEAMNFKRLGALVPSGMPRHARLATFSRRDDTVSKILARDRMASLDQKIFGTAVTNLGRLDWPREYGTLTLERMILKPGGGYPLVTVNLVVGAVTAAGRLSLALEFVEDNLDMPAAERIRDRAEGYLRE
ncbi:MAG: condensation domain-containing protein [Anaerolineae bacterium]